MIIAIDALPVCTAPLEDDDEPLPLSDVEPLPSELPPPAVVVPSSPVADVASVEVVPGSVVVTLTLLV